jgi:hypothetical protein
MDLEGKGIGHREGTVTLSKFLLTVFLLVRVGTSNLVKEWKLFLVRKAWKLLCLGLCAWPLCGSGG